MNHTSRTITGTIMIIIGLGLFVPVFFGVWFTLIYGIPILIIGSFILFNKKEDDIEQRKDERRKK
ncbi:MAG: hypothetical protein ABIB79_01620 [archaeon]